MVVRTGQLELMPLPVGVAVLLLEDRPAAVRALGVALSPDWPVPHLAGVLQRHAASAERDASFGVWLMIERATGTVVGDIGFHGPPDAAGRVELGYSVVPARRGRGYATGAAAALVRWAQAQPGVQAVVAGCDPGNAASVTVLGRAGFVRVGEAGGELRWQAEAVGK